MSNDESLNLHPPPQGNPEGGSQGPTLINTTSTKAPGSDEEGTKGKMDIEGPMDPINLSQELTAVGKTAGNHTTPVLTTGTQVDQHTDPSKNNSGAAQDTNWIEVVSNHKRKTPFLTTTAPNNLKPSVAAHIKQKGEAAIDAEKRFKTDVKLEFSTKSRKDINIRTEFVKIFKTMKLVEKSVAILNSKAVWTNPEEFPTERAFLEAFKVTQYSSPRRNPSVVMYFTCESRMTVNNIKYHPTVWHIIGQPGTYLYPDKFHTEETACPGFLINLHSKLVWKEAFIQKFCEILGRVKVNENDKVVQRRKKLHPHEEVNALTFFTLKHTTRKMQDVSANILNIISAKKDAELLKMLFSKAGEKFAQKWIFVPTGIHLLTSPGLVKAYLRQQNEYCSNIKSIAVDGITETAMLSGGKNGISIEQEIRNNFQGLESVEQTSQMNQRGR